MPPIPKVPIKIAVLDDYQGLAAEHFEPLKPTFEVTVFKDTLLPYNHPATPPSAQADLEARLKPFTVISSMRERTPFPAALLSKLPNLKLLATTGFRNAAIDLEACKKLGIVVTGTQSRMTRGRGPDSTTQHCVALILGLARNLAVDDRSVKEGGWQTGTSVGLGGRVFATLGLGKLGVSVARIMHLAFGMRIIAWSSSLTQEDADKKAVEAGLDVETDGEKTFLVVSKKELFERGDVVSLHYVLSSRSTGIVGKEELGVMKKSALFVNTSRAGLVVEEDLVDVLEQGRIWGAALDVFPIEPLPKETTWRNTKWGEEGRSKVLLTPHTGYVEGDALSGWYAEQAELVRKWHDGKELNNVLT